MVSLDRDRGILSTSDREYALNNKQWTKDKSRAAVNQRKKAIINRIRNGMLDFNHIANKEFPGELLRSVFYISEDGFNISNKEPVSLRDAGMIQSDYQEPRIEEACIDIVALIYRMYPPALANSIVEKGVSQAIGDFYPNSEVVDASYTPELRSPHKAHEIAKHSLNNGYELTDEQVRLLLEEGEVDPREVAEHIKRDNEPNENPRHKTN